MFVAATICSLPLLATAGITYEAGDQTLETRLCMSAAQDAPITFYKKHKDSGKSLHYISKNILCNDMSIANFAVLAGNKSNAKRLSRTLGRSPMAEELGSEERSKQSIVRNKNARSFYTHSTLL